MTNDTRQMTEDDEDFENQEDSLEDEWYKESDDDGVNGDYY